MKKTHILILVFILVACQISQPESAVINDLGCNSPCWKGVTPGKTNLQELPDLLKKIPSVDKDSIANVGVPGNYFNDIVRCYLVEPKSMTRFHAYFVDDKVILISLDYIKGDWNLTLEDTIEILGAPENILIVNYGNDTFINLIIPSKGIAFGYNTIDKPNWWKEKINSQNKIGWIDFFDPEMFSQLMDLGEFSSGILFGQKAIDSMQPWMGYGSIEEKYLSQK